MKREHGWRAAKLVGLLLAIACAGNAWALTDEEIFREFRFNFVIPGGRATGLGGAFVAAADDATAAEANPAALHYISRFEIFLEYRSTQPETLVNFGSTGSNDILSDVPYTDFTSVTNPEDREFVSFASFAFPFSMGNRRASLAFSRWVALDTQGSLSADNVGTTLDVSLVDFPIVVDPSTNPPSTERYTINNQVDGMLDAQIVQYDVSFEFSITRDFSFGLTAGLAELSMTSVVNSQTSDPLGVLTSIHPRVDVGGALSDIQIMTNVDGTDTAPAYSLGLHWHPDSIYPSGISPLRFGLVYRKGAKFSLPQTRTAFNADTGMFEPGASDELAQFENVLKVPDRWAVGVSYEVSRRWLLTLDLEQIKYSDLLEGFQTGANFFTSGLIPPTLLPGVSDLEFEVDDATVPRAGVEFNVTSRGGWFSSARVGYYNNPDSKIRLKEIDSGDPAVDQLFMDLFAGGEDQDHFTVGFSVGTPIGLRFDVAGDFTTEGNEFVVSGIYRFGGVRR